ncbi:cyclic-phosphate processing receiver domain-containing protein [uncultured Succinivibrio sp.]|uniref:cyclic-phosphate processing receiver domain-containing protein n=1 Tax=uncultured Succinivibrio sp. TaxID=540749 RepID=UPI0025EDF149|nr:cyclic-phosphate processing receiver domain-containing protein [uncultured Succinivibrio sp.]
MDFIRFVNSRDIREYLYELDYCLSGEQKLFLVDKCYRIPLEERLFALEELLAEPDEEVTIRHPDFFVEQPKDGDKSETESLHALTKGILENYRIQISLLKNEEPESYYELSILEKGRYEFYSFARFPSFEAAVNGYKEDFSADDRDSVAVVMLTKYYYSGTKNIYDNFSDRYVRAFFNSELELMHIYDNECLPQERFNYTTDKLLIYLPMPFEPGDILVNSDDCVYAGQTKGFNCDYESGAPFVAVSFIPDKTVSSGIDSSDINCYCYYFDSFSQYHLTSEVNVHNYDLEYYRKPLTGKDRFLRIFGLKQKDTSAVSDEELLLASEYCKNLEIQQALKQQLSWFNSSMSYYLSEENRKQKLSHDRYFQVDHETLLSMTDSIKLWLDDEREAPSGYIHCHSVNEAISRIKFFEKHSVAIEELNLDHDLGDFAKDGGDAIKLLDWLCGRETFYKIVLHTANPVGRANMQRTIDRYWPHVGDEA